VRPKIKEYKNLSDSIKISFKIFYQENGYRKSLPLEFYKLRKRFFPFWYFTFPAVTKEEEVVGPFWTKAGAKKYARNLLINEDFLNDK
jgi:hypothetical protein